MRPEDLTLSADGERPAGSIALDLIVNAVERVGPETFIYGSLQRGGDVIVRVPGLASPPSGERIRAFAPRDKLHLFSADGHHRLPT